MTEPSRLVHDDLTRSIIGAFFEVYNEFDYGLLESIYAAALREELVRRGHHVDRERWVDVHYKGTLIGKQRIDLIVDDEVVVEVKATEILPRFANRQLLNYLAVARRRVGLILHFGPDAKFYRMVHTPKLQPAPPCPVGCLAPSGRLGDAV